MTISAPLPLISIVTPSFNQGEFLEECIDSILSQNYPRLEYIIMDGGSSDGSVDTIRKYEKYLTYWQSQPDGGQYRAINDGFKRTSGDVMAWLNSDDKYHRDAFYKVAYLFDSSPEVEWLTGHPTFWGKDGEFTHIAPVLPTFCRKDFLEGKYNQPFIQQESTFWKRSLWDRAGSCLRSDLGYAGDMELWIRFFRHALLYSVGTFLGGYRGHGNQKAALHMDRYVEEAEILLVYENQLHASAQASAPGAPSPITFHVASFKKYLTDVLNGEFPSLLAATQEDVIQYLLNLTEKMRPEIESAKTVEELVQIRNSLSWRLTKPLRQIMDKFRR